MLLEPDLVESDLAGLLSPAVELDLLSDELELLESLEVELVLEVEASDEVLLVSLDDSLDSFISRARFLVP